MLQASVVSRALLFLDKDCFLSLHKTLVILATCVITVLVKGNDTSDSGQYKHYWQPAPPHDDTCGYETSSVNFLWPFLDYFELILNTFFLLLFSRRTEKINKEDLNSKLQCQNSKTICHQNNIWNLEHVTGRATCIRARLIYSVLQWGLKSTVV